MGMVFDKEELTVNGLIKALEHFKDQGYGDSSIDFVEYDGGDYDPIELRISEIRMPDGLEIRMIEC